MDCGRVILTGKAQDIRDKLMHLLPDDIGVPDYETQDGMFTEDPPISSEEEEGGSSVEFLPLNELDVGVRVEVFWQGEDSWYAGKIVGIDLDESQFGVHYDDDTTFWHKSTDYSVRLLET